MLTKQIPSFNWRIYNFLNKNMVLKGNLIVKIIGSLIPDKIS